MKRLLAGLEAVAGALNYVGTAAAILLTIFITLSTVVRYFLGAPLRFTEELVGLLFATMCFLTVPLGLLQRCHVTISLVTQLLPRRGRMVCELVGSLILIGFCAVFTVESWRFAALSFRLGARSEMGNLLLYPWMALMPLTMAFLLVIAAVQLAELVLGRRLPPAPDESTSVS